MHDPVARVWVIASGVWIGAGLGHDVDARWAFAVGISALVGATMRRHRVIALAGIAVLALCGGVLDASLHSTRGDPLDRAAAGSPRCSLSGRVQEPLSNFGDLVQVGSLACGDERNRGGAVVVPRFDAHPGSTVDAVGWLLALPGGPYGAMLRNAGASASLDATEVQVGSVASPAFRIAAAVRDSLDRAAARLAGDEQALLEGVAVGDTAHFDPATLEEFRRAGLSHLLAVSGENLAMLIGAVAVLATRLARRTRIVVMAASAGLFVLVVGPQPSVLRAAVMAGIALIALAVGRSADPLNALGLAVVVVIGLRPGLAGAAGLQLSVAATAGIVVWTSRVADRLSFLPRAVALAVAATTSAQIAVTPLLIATFGRVSIMGIPANMLALPAVPAATVLGLAAGAVGVFSSAVAGALVVLAQPFLSWVLQVASFFGRPSWAAIALPRWSAWPAGALVGLWLVLGLRGPRRDAALSLGHVQVAGRERRG